MSHYKQYNVQSTLTSHQRMKNRAWQLIQAKSAKSFVIDLTAQEQIDLSIKEFEPKKLSIGRLYEIEQGEIANQTKMECQNGQNGVNLKIEEQQEMMEKEMMEEEISSNYHQSPPPLSPIQTFRSYFKQIVFQPVFSNIQIGAQQQSFHFLIPKQNQLNSAEHFNKQVVERWYNSHGNFGNSAKQKYYKQAIEKNFMQGKYRYAVQQCVTNILLHKQNIPNLMIYPRKNIEEFPNIPVGSLEHSRLVVQLGRNLRNRRICKAD